MNELLTKSIIAQLSNLNKDEVLTIAKECNEVLGVCSANDYSEIMCESRRTVYDKISKGKIKHIVISGQKFPCINT